MAALGARSLAGPSGTSGTSFGRPILRPQGPPSEGRYFGLGDYSYWAHVRLIHLHIYIFAHFHILSPLSQTPSGR
jgi:hypothetical protein